MNPLIRVVRFVGVTAVVVVGTSAAPTTANASCATGVVPTTLYTGTVVGRITNTDEPNDYRLTLDDGRVVVLQIAHNTEDGFDGPLPQVGHRYRVRGAPGDTARPVSIGLSGCVPSAQLVDLGAVASSSHGGSGGVAVGVAAVVVALLAAAGLVVTRRRHGANDGPSGIS